MRKKTLWASVKRHFQKIYFKYFAKIKHFTVVLRGGLSPEQIKYLKNHKSLLKIGEWTKKVNTQNENKKILEIGYGNGSHLQYLGEIYKQGYDIYGAELDRLSTCKFLNKIDQFSFSNIQLINADARKIISNLKPSILEDLFILFSDPWPKRRDFGRRLINQEFLKEVLEKLKAGGKIYIATDIESYKQQIQNILENLKINHHFEYICISEKDFVYEKGEYDMCKIFETKFAIKAKKEERVNTVFVISKI